MQMEAQSDSQLDLSQLPRLQRLFLKMDSKVLMRVLSRTLEQVAELLVHVEFVFNFHRGSLSMLFALPRLKSLVLCKVFGSAKIEASSSCPLERLVLVDCSDIDLAFLESLARLRVLRFTDQAFTRSRELAAAVPRCVQARLTDLELDLYSMLLHHDGYLSGYSSLRRLCLKSADKGYGLHEFSDSVRALVGLDTLELYVPLPRARELVLGLNLARLDVRFEDWPEDEAHRLACLRSLVLRGVTDLARLAGLSRCPALRSLKLVGYPAPREFPAEFIPPQLTKLELVHFWPSSPLDVFEVWLERESFARMGFNGQAQMRARVKNLYVVSTLRDPTRTKCPRWSP